MKRKIIEWETYTPPPQYTATLECEHSLAGSDGDGNYSLEEKENIEKYQDNEVECHTCGILEKEALALEKKAKDIRAKMKK